MPVFTSGCDLLLFSYQDLLIKHVHKEKVWSTSRCTVGLKVHGFLGAGV